MMSYVTTLGPATCDAVVLVGHRGLGVYLASASGHRSANNVFRHRKGMAAARLYRVQMSGKDG